MQADDDDSIVSSLILKLRYSKLTQHTVFFKTVANKRKLQTDNKATKYTKVPRLEKWLCIINIA